MYQNHKEANDRYKGKDIYQMDQRPYYGVDDEYKKLSNRPKGMIPVSIDLKDLKNTFPDKKNIQILEDELKNIKEKESLNSITLSGKYFNDPAPYYDPTASEKAEKIEEISNTIEDMKNELNKNENPEIFTEENFKVTTKIQNYSNSNRESTNEFIKNSYYEENSSKKTDPKTTVFNIGEKADVRKHNLVEVDTLSDNLGSKYVDERKSKYTEADVKESSKVNNLI